MTRALLTGMLILGYAAAQPIPSETRYPFGGSIPFGKSWEGPLALDLVAAVVLAPPNDRRYRDLRAHPWHQTEATLGLRRIPPRFPVQVFGDKLEG